MVFLKAGVILCEPWRSGGPADLPENKRDPAEKLTRLKKKAGKKTDPRPVKQRKKDMKCAGMKGSEMTGQQSYLKIHDSVCREELVYIRALQGHSGKNLDIPIFINFNLEDLCQADVEQAKAEKQCTSHSCRQWIRAPTRSTSPTST